MLVYKRLYFKEYSCHDDAMEPSCLSGGMIFPSLLGGALLDSCCSRRYCAYIVLAV